MRWLSDTRNGFTATGSFILPTFFGLRIGGIKAPGNRNSIGMSDKTLRRGLLGGLRLISIFERCVTGDFSVSKSASVEADGGPFIPMLYFQFLRSLLAKNLSLNADNDFAFDVG